MKIIIFISQLTRGGAERVAVNLANYLCFKNDITLLSLTNSKVEYDVNCNCKIDFIDGEVVSKNRFKKNILRYKKIKKYFVNSNADIILSFLPEPSIFSLSVKHIINSKVIISVRNDPKVEYKNLIYKILMKIYYPKADGIIFQTKEAMNYFGDKIKSKGIIIPNSINPDFYTRNYSINSNHRIINVGRLNVQKNQKMLITAFSKVVEKYPDSKLYIYGEGPERSELENYIRILSLEQKVFLPGVTDNIIDELILSEIFVLSSDYEGMPNSLLEALALGLPSISTDCPCGGPSEIIENNSSGILIKVGDYDQLANKINYLFENKQIEKKLSDNARKEMLNYSPDLINKVWEEYINKFNS